MNKLDIKNNLLDHSEAKVKLLGEYLKRYLSVVSNNDYTNSIHIHDLFCGPGIYENGGYGSPIVALKEVKQTYYTLIDKKKLKLPKIHCYFNDIDSGRINKLRQSIKDLSIHYTNIGDLNFSSNEYKDEVENLKHRFINLKNDKAFIFIDPYGYKDFKANHIKDLLGINKKTEILIWLPIQFIYRFSKEGRTPALENLINDLKINDSINLSKNVWEFIAILRNGFQNYLGDSFFVDQFSLKKEENTVFCLFFFTSHIRGFEKMLESKWEIDTEQGRGWEYNGNTPTLFFEQKTNEFETELCKYLNENKRFNCDVYEFTLRSGYLIKHTNEILNSLQKSGKLEVYMNDGRLARKKSFYIKYYKPTHIDFKKVYFVLKN